MRCGPGGRQLPAMGIPHPSLTEAHQRQPGGTGSGVAVIHDQATEEKLGLSVSVNEDVVSDGGPPGTVGNVGPGRARHVGLLVRGALWARAEWLRRRGQIARIARYAATSGVALGV